MATATKRGRATERETERRGGGGDIEGEGGTERDRRDRMETKIFGQLPEK